MTGCQIAQLLEHRRGRQAEPNVMTPATIRLSTNSATFAMISILIAGVSGPGPNE